MKNTESEIKQQPCQIVIQPVENGFIIHGMNIDGVNREKRLVASSVGEVRVHLHEIADLVYETVEGVESSSTYTPSRARQ